jgi:hypothetical protein
VYNVLILDAGFWMLDAGGWIVFLGLPNKRASDFYRSPVSKLQHPETSIQKPAKIFISYDMT